MEQFKRILGSAELVYGNKDYTSATILYFKAIFVALDYVIQRRLGRTPKDHNERFKLLQKEFKEYYSKLDLTFQVYRDTYSKTISKEVCEEIRDEAEYFIAEAEKRS